MANLSTSVLSLPNLGPGSTDSASVKALQSALVAAGYLTQAQMNTGPGIYGPQTTAAVSKWQSENGIPTGGNAGYFGPASKSFIQTTGNQSQSTPQTNVFSNPAPYQAPASYVAPPYSQPTPQTTPQQSTDVSAPTVALQPGSTDIANVKKLQDYLVSKGYMTQSQINSGYGIYGPQTTAGVAAMQKALGVDNSTGVGYYGPRTMTAITGGTTQNPTGSTSTTDPNTPIIHPTTVKSDHTDAPPGTSTDIPGMPPGMQNLTVYNLPTEAFSAPTASTQLMPGTPEYQAAMDKLDTSYYDVLQQQMNASTQEQQQAAQYSWDQLKSQIENTLNVSLSNNALNAWDQIQGLKNQASPYFGGRNIEGSGLENQSIDAYLKGIRQTDSNNRTTSKNDQEAKQMSYYQNFATPEQVKALVQSDPAKAKSYGLVPSSDITNSLNATALKAKYPTMSQDDINNAIASVLDENGNYRSGLYQKYMTGSNLGINMGNVGTTVSDQYGNPIVTPVTPGDMGKLDINAAKSQYQAINTPYAAGAKDDLARRTLGSTPLTSGATSGTSSGTQFNKITPAPGSGVAPLAPNTPGSPSPTLGSPVPSAGQNTSSVPVGSKTGASPNSTTNNPLGSTTKTNQLLGGNYLDPLTGKQVRAFTPLELAQSRDK